MTNVTRSIPTSWMTTMSTIEGPLSVEFEPFPQDVFDQLTRLLKEEEETTQIFDYVPTSVDEQGHAVDQFGIRIQKTTRPPYSSPDEWTKMRNKDKRVAMEEVEVGSRNSRKSARASAI